MKFKQENWRDIQKYYQGTYVKFAEFGDTLHYIENVTQDEITGKDENKDDFVLYLHDSQEYVFEYLLPHKAVFQYGGDAYLLQRIPARQYKRGLCQENTSFTKVTSGERQSLSWQLMTAYTNKQKYFSLKEAIYGKGKMRSLAVTNRMSYARGNDYLYVDNKVIATFNRESKVLATIPLFFDDVKELIAQDPFEVTIK